MSGPPPKAEVLQDLKNLTLPTLAKKYERESNIHRNIMMTRGTGITGNWRDFRAFLNDLGPCPGEGFNLVLLNRYERTYGPGKARWMNSAQQKKHEEEFDKQLAAKATEQNKLLMQAQALKTAKMGGTPTMGQWTSMGGRTVGYSEVAKRLNIPVAALSKTLKDGRTVDDLVKRAGSADELIDRNAHWLPPEENKKDSFLEAFRVWHMQVLPPYSRAATPTFLFLFIALPMMKECRDELIDLNLWTPLGHRAEAARDAHIAWKKYTELMPRAQAAMMEIPIYASYSLLSELDKLCERIVTAESRFRAGPKGPGAQAA